MRIVLLLTWLFLKRHPWRCVLLTLAVSLVLALPLSVGAFTAGVEKTTMQRATSTPLVVGRRGSATDLVLSSLYFKAAAVPAMSMEDVELVGRGREVKVAPLILGFEAEERSLVGVDDAYYGSRKFQLAAGRLPRGLGECLLGASAAEASGSKPGDKVVSQPASLFDVTRSKSAELEVVGILSRTASPDDEAIFTTLETCWIMQGHGHGHGPDVETADGKMRLTPETRDSFHFHGEPNEFPVTSALVFPANDRAQALTLSAFQDNERLQALRSDVTINALLETVFSAQKVTAAVLALMSLVCALLLVALWWMSQTQRREEYEMYSHLGLRPSQLRLLRVADALVIFLAGFLVSLALLALVGWVAANWTL